MNIYALPSALYKIKKFAKNIGGRKSSSEICFLNGENAMPENYARENTNRANSKTNSCKNKSANEVNNARTPMSKQNAAQRKTQDCDR